MLTRSRSQTLSNQLASRLGERIRDRLLATGARLPSVRQYAQQQGVSPSTVVAAYEQLLAKGMVEARKNKGFYVREVRLWHGSSRLDVPPVMQPVQTASEPYGVKAPIDATVLIRGMFQGGERKPQPSMGALPPAWLESNFLSAAVRKVTSASMLHSYSLQYGEPQGDTGLRSSLSQKLADMSIHALPEQIITTIGATQALDVISRALLQPGDCVMVEEPGWAVEFARLQALGMRILPVPRGANGPDLAVMANYCMTHAPKLLVSVSVYHNPTGQCLSPHCAHQLVQLANQYNFYIVEDDTYGHLAPAYVTRLCALDGLQRTFYVSSFSKILAPNWRVGYLAAPQSWIERLLDIKLLTILTTPALMEKAMAICIDQGHLRRHAQRISTQLDAARARSVKLALTAGCQFVTEPAGLFGWVDTGVDTDALAQHMLDEGYLLAPGSLFHAERQPGTLMRINFATTQEAGFWRVFEKLRRLVK